ncbi:hypothetical protein [Sphingomonas sp. MMS24-J13]|uniref:hypothetical protein n=1 Tax=Sphingomonas sp. MMS24-J13 TaxID=3238686 RepID=UPI00384CD4EC
MVGSTAKTGRAPIAIGDVTKRQPVQVRADIPDDHPALSFPPAWPGIATMSDDKAMPPEKSGVTGCWRAADLKRAIRAAEQAGLTAYRVEIASDGTISIIVGK